MRTRIPERERLREPHPPGARPAGPRPQHVALAYALQRAAGNAATARVLSQATGGMLARSAKIGPGGQLVKGARFEFEPPIIKHLSITATQHKAHVIPYDEFVRSVIDPINAALGAPVGDRKDWIARVRYQIEVVFPNGAVVKRHAAGALALIGATNYKRALLAVDKIETDVLGGTVSVADVNELINALNNSPDNLRAGDATTNMSIQQGLDMTPKGKTILPAGTDVTHPAWVKEQTITKTEQLTKPLKVLRVDPLSEKQVWLQVTTTWSEAGTVFAYSSGDQLQASEHPGMKSATMTKAAPVPLAIKVPGTSVFYLFQTS